MSLSRVLFLLLCFSLVAVSCKKNAVPKESEIKETVYQDYEQDWKEVEQLEKKGLGKAILRKTDSILVKAIEDENSVQIFKALVYRSKYEDRIEEESTLNILNRFEDRINQSQFPLKQVLHSATAELYFQYYNQNRWQFRNRTETINFDPQDLRSWSLQQILDKISEHYASSLLAEEQLATIPLSSYKEIVVFPGDKSGKNSIYNGTHLRPSLYDFLADRALNYYKRNEGRVQQAIHEFKPDGFAIFGSVGKYVEVDFQSPDSSSLAYQAARVYQNLLSVHAKDREAAVLIDFNLDRLRYFHNISKDELKDSLYLKALNRFYAEHKTAEVAHAIAKLYFQWGRNYDVSKEEDRNRWYLKKAFDLCSQYAGTKSYGEQLCENLKEQIESKEFSFSVESVYPSNKNLLYRATYKNVDSLYFTIIRIPHRIDRKSNRLSIRSGREEFLKELGKMPKTRSWKQVLKNENDFQQHSTELSMEKLPSGSYILVGSLNKEFEKKGGITSYSKFKISDLSFMHEQENASDNFQVYALHRNTGKGISGAKLTVYSSTYDYNSRRNKLKQIGQYTFGKNGGVSVPVKNNDRNVELMLTYKGDTLTTNDSYYFYENRVEPRTIFKTHFFLDRAIYRPGQTIYFKGIVIESKGRESEIKPNHSTEITLYNKNGEKLSSKKVRTNEYGSYEGSFTLPTSGLNGNYRIADKYSYSYFSVEEYKRPTFQILLDTSSLAQKVNEQVSISGKVEAFSGASIASAEMKYRVVRRTVYPYWSYWRSYFPPANEKEIANGTLAADENGKFRFQFFAQADITANTKWNPVFNYEVILDATSLSGETQSLTETVKIGTKSLQLSTNLKTNTQLEQLKGLVISAKNTQGKKVDAKVAVKLWKLKTPKCAYKSKYWAKPDLNLISEKEYNSLFPQYPQNEENEIREFEKEILLLSEQTEANEASQLFGAIKPGAYELELTTIDRYGEEIIQKERFTLFDENTNRLAYPRFISLTALKSNAEPGENATFLIGTSLNQLRLLYEVVLEGKLLSKEWIVLNNEQKKITIPVKEEHRGGFVVRFIGVHSNRAIQLREEVQVPFTNKQLAIQLGTFRSKLQPGSEEKWSLTISGMNQEKLAAEVLVGMYDQSLDQFRKEDWSMNLYLPNRSRTSWKVDRGFSSFNSRRLRWETNSYTIAQRVFPSLNWFGFHLGGIYVKTGGISASYGDARFLKDAVAVEELAEISSNSEFTPSPRSQIKRDSNEEALKEKPQASNPVRTDFRETAFFVPQLKTDKDGRLSFEFKMPEALTQWKYRILAHTKDLKVGKKEGSIRTQKELMLTPNFPRFFRETDVLTLSVLINNLSEDVQGGSAKLEFFDAYSNSRIDLLTENTGDPKFSVLPGGNTTVSWNVNIPLGLKAIKYRVVASSQQFSDGEEKVIPVLSNRMLVTESLPLAVRGNQTKRFTFDRLKNPPSNSLTNESYTLEFTSNPAWYAVQALPYVAEGKKESSEQVFSRLYANSLAESIANSNPRIKEIVELWKGENSEELTSKLFQNEELKSILIEETPWLQQAKSESEQKRMIALLFDYNKMASEKTAAIRKLKQQQLLSGGWSWYKGMQANRHITQYIVNGFGHLKQLGIDYSADAEVKQMLMKAIAYIDNEIVYDYNQLLENKAKLKEKQIGYYQVHYLYTRSFFTEIALPNDKTAFNYYLKQAGKYWTNSNLYMKGMTALALNRYDGKSEVAQLIGLSLKDNALQSESLGMYWKKNRSGYYWYNSAIETQAILIELFKEVMQDQESVEELKIWLLKQKQTQMWSNSKSTAVACYALLLDNLQLLNNKEKVKIAVGHRVLAPESTEAGTGYFKQVWNKAEVNKDMATIEVQKKSNGIAWGAAYWQYYDDLQSITNAKVEELSISKTLFKVQVDEEGEKMKPVDGNSVSVGDKIRVRLRIESKRDLEFVHLKDMRAAGFEPINVISRYKYQDGLGYYESAKDASTNFFIDRLRKGVYVFEYDLRATVKGSFSNGISTLQCQYAPEFTTHSQGQVVKISD